MATTDSLEKVITVVRILPADTQDDLAHMLLAYLDHDEEVVRLTPEEEADVAEAECGDFATDEELRAIWAKYDP